MKQYQLHSCTRQRLGPTRRGLVGAFAGLMALPQLALADLPAVQQPTSGGGSGLYDTLQGYLADGVLLIALVIAATAFVVVGGAAIGKFNDARKRGEWGEFGVVVVVGVVLVVATIWLSNQAITIL